MEKKECGNETGQGCHSGNGCPQSCVEEGVRPSTLEVSDDSGDACTDDDCLGCPGQSMCYDDSTPFI